MADDSSSSEPRRSWPFSICTSAKCRRPVIWARTERGSAMPVDRDPSPTGNVRLVERGYAVPVAVVVKAAELVAAQPALDGGEPEPLHTSHFATCPDAPTFRRDKRRPQ